MLLLPEMIMMTIFGSILKMDKSILYSDYGGTLLGNTISNIIMIILVFILKKPLQKLFNYDLSTNKKIIIVSSLTLVTMAIFFYQLVVIFRLSNNIYGYLIIITTLIMILFYLLKQRIDNNIILKRYDDLLNIMKNYESDIEEQRAIIHETKNELMTIKSKIKDKEKESIIVKYIDSILGDKISISMSKYSKFKYLPSNGIKGFFYYKLLEAEEKEIKVSVNISKQIEDSFLGKLETKDFKDLVRMIGVYLDNAIDASADSEDKKLGIEIYLIKENIEIIISNTYDNNIDTDKIGIERFTTKGKNHGYGLLLVKKILKGNNLFETFTTINNKLYIQKIIITKKS